MTTRKTGIEGEFLAQVYLRDKGYKIIATNLRIRRYEIDILAELKDELIVIEVKYRATDKFGDPESSVTKQKQQFLIEAADHFLETNPGYVSTRFDVIAILNTPTGKKIRHHKDAFFPEIEDL